ELQSRFCLRTRRSAAWSLACVLDLALQFRQIARPHHVFRTTSSDGEQNETAGHERQPTSLNSHFEKCRVTRQTRKQCCCAQKHGNDAREAPCSRGCELGRQRQQCTDTSERDSSREKTPFPPAIWGYKKGGV